MDASPRKASAGPDPLPVAAPGDSTVRSFPDSRENALDFRRLFETSPNLYLVVNPAWEIVAVNDAYLRATMTRREALIGRNTFDVFPDNPNDPQTRGVSALVESWQRVVATGAADVMPIQKYDIRRPVAEGGEFEVRYWSVVNSPVLGIDSRVEFIIHRVEDVTHVVRQQQSFEEQEKRTAALTERANLLELDVAMRVDELRKSYRDLHKAHSELNAIRSGLELQVERRTADLQKRNQDLEEIAYAASHDLQEPLRAVGGYCQLLMMEYGADLADEARDYLEKAVHGAQRMSAMVKGILQFARATHSAEPLRPVDANVALLEALTSLEVAVRDADANVLRGDLPTVISDHVLLAQLFQNLIGNALKYRSDRPIVVMVNASRSESEWLFAVADNGIGIPADSREQVFAMFKRIRTGRPVPGTGIGLALCRQIIDHHGGRIWIDSQEGAGSTVYFTIPIRDGV
ncbi:MAG TPA: ATP-binding protein [Caulifigura sp.]|nr:ATP-binding protein [Caulifigura sp.]